jgi:phosphoribosylglycinamide formyltransferase-1
MENKFKIAVFASGEGTNLQAIIDACKEGKIKGTVALVISDNPSAYAIERAKQNNIDVKVFIPSSFPSKDEYEEEISKTIDEYKIDLICLAGYMRILGKKFVRKYYGRIMNIHPALLPSFPGAHAIKDALSYGVKITGCTVHFVTEEVDKGPIIIQSAVPVLENDTFDTLLARIHKEEHRIYPLAIQLFIEGKLKIEGRKVIVKE